MLLLRNSRMVVLADEAHLKWVLTQNYEHYSYNAVVIVVVVAISAVNYSVRGSAQ